MDDTDYLWVKAICKKGDFRSLNNNDLTDFSKEVSRKIKLGMYLEQARVDTFNCAYREGVDDEGV